MSYEYESDKEKTIFLFLDELRESGACNMFESGNYVQENFHTDQNETREYVLKWMRTFEERHP